MREHEESGARFRGERTRSPSRPGGADAEPPRGVPGRGAIASRLGRLGPAGRLDSRLGHARCALDGVEHDPLPALRDAVAARKMNAARQAAHALERDLARAAAELADARRLVRAGDADIDPKGRRY
jgi:hypothetical protein